MPCHDSRDEPEYVRKEALEEFTHNSPVASMLCEAMRIINNAGLQDLCSENLRKWSREHDERDNRRSNANHTR